MRTVFLYFYPYIIFLTPSPYGHSPYLICDEQRERVKASLWTAFLFCEDFSYISLRHIVGEGWYLDTFSLLRIFFNPSVTMCHLPLYFALQNTGEEFQIPTPKRYVIICCSKYRYSHFSKKIKVECEMSYDVVRVGGGDWKCRFEQPFISLELWGYSPSPLCCEVNRGNARRAKGLNPQSKILWNLF